jgi:hypothetical protein
MTEDNTSLALLPPPEEAPPDPAETAPDDAPNDDERQRM